MINFACFPSQYLQFLSTNWKKFCCMFLKCRCHARLQPHHRTTTSSVSCYFTGRHFEKLWRDFYGHRNFLKLPQETIRHQKVIMKIARNFLICWSWKVRRDSWGYIFLYCSLCRKSKLFAHLCFILFGKRGCCICL